MSTMTLKMPVNYVEIDREEMEYVDGGYYISYDTLVAITGATASMGGVAVYSACMASMGAIRAFVDAIPTIGWALAIIGTYALSGAPGAFRDAILQRKGIDIGLKKTDSGIPYGVSYTVK